MFVDVMLCFNVVRALRIVYNRGITRM